MDYYLLPLEKVEVDQFEQALRKINYDVDDRSFVWTEELIDKIISTMTKENAYKIIMQFLPEPVADKFAELFEVK
ncbi:MAG: hypothetical protein ACTHKF_05830 [Candidatus Nitrosocosmicus sp.]